MANLKLVYFDIRGRAEMIRLMLAAADVKYDDQRVQFGADWQKLKPSTPYGSLPYIVYKGKTWGQSTAIGPFLAKEFGFYGSTNEEQCRIDEVTGLWEDQLKSALVQTRWGKTQEDKDAAIKKAITEDKVKFFGYYERFLKENDSKGYIVGNKLSLADFYIFDMIDNLLLLDQNAIKDYPLLQRLRNNVEANPKVKHYLDNKKATIF